MTRRPRGTAAVVACLLAAVLALAACGGGSSTPPARSGASGPWSFRDDLGHTVRLDHTPTRIAGYSDALGSLWNYGIKPVASFGQAPMADEPGYRGKDLSGVTEVGRAYGEINLESLAAARPQIIVVTHYPKHRGAALDANGLYYGFKDLAQQKKVAAIAPIVVLGVSGPVTAIADRFVTLAESLGASASTISAAKTKYATAAARLRTAAAHSVTVSAIAGYADEGVYIARWQDDPLLDTWHSLGVRIPDLSGTNYYWLQTSWENVAKYATDVVLYSARAMPRADLVKQAGFAQTPAVTGGQLHPWAVVAFDYVAIAADTAQLAGWLSSAKQLT